VSDIALELVDSLKVLDPNGRLEKRTFPVLNFRFVTLLASRSLVLDMLSAPRWTYARFSSVVWNGSSLSISLIDCDF
jgi:hypothetical protein